MRLPWISRSSHEEMTAHLTAELAELKQERQILLDRLATLGLGGPLFHLPTQAEEQEEPEEEVIDPQAEIDRILALSRRPSLMAKAIREKAIRDQKIGGRGPGVARIPKIDEAFERADAEGRKQG